jgi:hypothetical protein
MAGTASHNVCAAPEVHPAQLPPPPPTRRGRLLRARALQLGGHPSRVHPALLPPAPPLRPHPGVDHPEHRQGDMAAAVTLGTGGLRDAEAAAPEDRGRLTWRPGSSRRAR